MNHYKRIVRFEDGSTLHGDIHKTRALCDAKREGEIDRAFKDNDNRVVRAIPKIVEERVDEFIYVPLSRATEVAN